MDKKPKGNERRNTENYPSVAGKKKNIKNDNKPEIKIEKTDSKGENKNDKQNRLTYEKDIKIGTDEEDDNKHGFKPQIKQKKQIEIPISITPKSYKTPINDKTNKNLTKVNKKNLNASLYSQLKSTQIHINSKDTESKKLYGINNPNCESILSSFEMKLSGQRRENFLVCFNSIKNLKNNDFFCKFHEFKKNFKDFINNVDTDNYNFMLKFFEHSINQINNKLKSITNDEYDISNSSDDMAIDYLYKNNNAVYFEIPIRERAMSVNVNRNCSVKEKLDKKFAQKQRPTSAEIEKRINNKLERAERNKENIKRQYQKNANKLMNKIMEIKKKKKKEKEERFQKFIEKTDNFEKRHKQFLEERTSRAKTEKERVAEINFINRMDKENRSFSLLKKLDISIERRNNYMMLKLSKTLKRNMREEEVENRRKQNLDEKVQKLNQKLLKVNEKKNNTMVKEKISTMQKIENALKRKEKLDEKYEFLKNVFSENFIYQLIEADYFEIEDLYDITNLTKFEIIKSKLKRDKEKIDKMFETRKKNQLKNYKKSSVASGGIKSIISSENSVFDENKNLETFAEDESQSDKDSLVESSNKLSKSFTYNNQDDFNDLFNETIKNTQNTEEKRKKKKKKIKKENITSNIKKKLLKTINSLSTTELSSFFRKMNRDAKMRKFLIKSSKNGKYIKSKIILTNDININSTSNDINNYNSFSASVSNNAVETIFGKCDDNSVENLNTNIIINNTLNDDKKEKLMKTIMQNSEILKNENNSTILINSESLSNILEKNSVTVRWCKLCNTIFSSESECTNHINSKEHKKLKIEYGLSLQDDSNLILLFQSLPGDISEDLRNERINAIKNRFKKLKQKISLKQVKHENFWSYKQDFPSLNKQRMQKLSFDIEKLTFPIIKDYEQLENNLKEVIKILEQKKQNDLHIMRQLKITHFLVEILKKPSVCHKSELKNLMKIIEYVIKIVLYFCTLTENRNYLIVTNRLSVLLDFLLWVFNKPTKIPLGITFLPDLIYIITIHIKHRIPFEYLAMKDDFLEYAFLSNILVKFKAKYTSLVGPIDLTGGFGSLPLVLLKSLGMIEALSSQININYSTKPVYVKSNKISENIFFVLENTELVGCINLLTTLLLYNGPIKPKSETSAKMVLPQTIISASLIAVKILNNCARLDLGMFQGVFKNTYLQEQIYHIFNYIIVYSMDNLEGSDDVKELLHETILLINYFTLNNEKHQNCLSKGEVTVIQKISSLPHTYFFEKRFKDILFPTLISISYNNQRNTEILNKEMNIEMIVMFLKEKIQLEPIIEEEEYEKFEENSETDINLIKTNINNFVENAKTNISTNNSEMNTSRIKKRTLSYSSASSTKSCHDMINGVSDYVLLYHRLPRNLWEKAYDFYSNFGK